MSGAPLPSLSEVRALDYSQMWDQACWLDATADLWEESFTDIRDQIAGIDWGGEARDAGVARANADLEKARAAAEAARATAKLCRTSAPDLAAAQRSVLHGVDFASEAGFGVGEDYTVTDRQAGGTAAQRAERQDRAQEFAADIGSRVIKLTGLQHEVAGKLTTTAAGIRELSFDESPMPGIDSQSTDGHDRPAPWPWDDRTVPGTPVPGDLPIDDEAWKIASQSPTLLDEWNRLKAEGWRFTFNPGEGTYTKYESRPGGQKFINIDPNLKEGDPAQLVSAMAHEMGHALYGPPNIDRGSRDACIQSQLDNEGAATLNNITVEREILAHSGPDIMASPADDKFKRVYDQYIAAGRTKEAYQNAITAIGKDYGALIPSTAPSETYRDYYGEACPAK